MKSSPTFGLLAALLLCAAMMSPMSADAAGPFKKLRSSLQKAGKVLNPFKREAQPPAAPAPAPLKLRAGAPVKSAKKSASRPSTAKAVPISQKTKSASKSKKSAAAAGATALSATASSKKKSNSQEQDGEKPSEKAPEDGEKLPDRAEGELDVDGDGDVNVEPEENPVPAPEVIIRQPLAEIPFGTPVMGRKGQVRSPFAPDQGMVDVSGIPAGTRVKCPFSEKVFRVP